MFIDREVGILKNILVFQRDSVDPVDTSSAWGGHSKILMG